MTSPRPSNTPWVQQSFESESASVGRARQFVTEALRLDRAGDEVCDTFALVTSELITNFIEHGAGSPIDVGVGCTPTAWELTVAGAANAAPTNPVLDPIKWSIAPAEQSTGRGLGIVQALCDDLTVTASDRMLDIHCRLFR